MKREDYLAVDDVEIETVTDVPYWGDVFIRTFSAGQRDKIEAAHLKNPFQDFRARFVVASMCDENGKLIFTDQDIPVISKRSAKTIDKVFEAVGKLNKISKEDVEDMEKNSERVQPDE